MNRTHRRSNHRDRPLLFKSDFDDEREDALNAPATRDGPIPVDDPVAKDETRLLLEAVFYASRDPLVATPWRSPTP